MMTIQKAIVGAAVAAALGTGIYHLQQNAQLRGKLQALEQKQESLAAQVAQLTAGNERLASHQTEAPASELPRSNPPNELLRLRGAASLNAREIAELKSGLADGKTISDSLSKMFLNYYAASTEGERASQNNAALTRVQRMSAALTLTPEQQQQVRKILLGNVEARAQMELAASTGSIPFEQVRAQRDKIDEEEASALAGILSAEQMNGYKQINDAEADARYKSWAQAMADQIKSPLQLTSEQQAQVAAVLYSLKPGEGGINIPYYANAQEQIEMRMRALESVLSADQIQWYRQKLLDDTEQHNDIAAIARALKRSKPSP